MEVKERTARSLVRKLTSAADESAVAAAISEIRLLSKHDAEIRPLLADAGAVPLLADQLLSGGCAAEDAAAALLNLSISSREALMATPILLDALAAALRLPPPSIAAQHAAAVLYSLLSVDSYRPIIGAKRDLISSLVPLLRSPNPTRSIKDSLKALFGIALYPLNRPTLVESGCVQAIFSLVVKDGRSGVVEDATAVIAQVAGCGESVEAFRKVAGVRILVDLMDPAMAASKRARENAAAALLNLVMAGGNKAAGDVREVEGAEKVVKHLAEDQAASARGKAKAEALLRALDGARMGRRHHRIDDLNGDDYDAYSSSPSPSSSLVSASLSSFAGSEG
ncbi:U-box domain-containing protein 16 [Typha angustifolia]|uniref:U-box domain-containing protein 16 n=1 Tax=Typha angustifolia TaxID=59011 RepID=UPI003C2D7917